MPARSQAQQKLFAAADHGADFPMAKKLRASMSKSKLREFVATKRKGLPAHVANKHPHRNLGAFLHPPKAKQPGLADQVTALRTKGAFSAPRGATGKK